VSGRGLEREGYRLGKFFQVRDPRGRQRWGCGLQIGKKKRKKKRRKEEKVVKRKKSTRRGEKKEGKACRERRTNMLESTYKLRGETTLLSCISWGEESKGEIYFEEMEGEVWPGATLSGSFVSKLWFKKSSGRLS